MNKKEIKEKSLKQIKEEKLLNNPIKIYDNFSFELPLKVVINDEIVEFKSAIWNNKEFRKAFLNTTLLVYTWDLKKKTIELMSKNPIRFWDYIYHSLFTQKWLLSDKKEYLCFFQQVFLSNTLLLNVINSVGIFTEQKKSDLNIMYIDIDKKVLTKYEMKIYLHICNILMNIDQFYRANKVELDEWQLLYLTDTLKDQIIIYDEVLELVDFKKLRKLAEKWWHDAWRELLSNSFYKTLVETSTNIFERYNNK